MCYALAVERENGQKPNLDGKERVMNTQFKKGVLELCVLSLLKQGDKYAEMFEMQSHYYREEGNGHDCER